MISTIGKKLVNLQGLLHPSNLINFGPETAENRWRVFAHPLNFRILEDTSSLTAWTLYNRQQANFGTWICSTTCCTKIRNKSATSP